MEILFATFVVVGGILFLIGKIWIVVEAFKTGCLWGAGTLLVPFVDLIFTILYFHHTKRALGLWVAGFVLMAIGFAIEP